MAGGRSRGCRRLRRPWKRSSTALRGADTLVFVSSDGPVAQVMVHHHNVIRAARASGVAHIVALSGLDADPCSPFCYAVSYGYTERLLAGSGCLVSIARASIYSEFFTGFLARARASGQVRLPRRRRPDIAGLPR
jgi:NAD(P)H dehydrogenase (quinone)